MADTELTQAESDRLHAMQKVPADDLAHNFPGLAGVLTVPLVSRDRTESFCLDVRRGRLDLAKVTLQNRARQVVVLVRLDLGGPPHRNPDDTVIPCPHLHLYREGYADKWAFAVPPDRFTDLTDRWQVLLDFMEFCNVVERPRINRELFA